MCNNFKLTAQYCLSEHKKAIENWREGKVAKVWHDEDNILCIKYESGNWWRYKLNKNILEWW